MGVRSTNKTNYGPRWESLNTALHNGHMGEFYNTQMRAGKGTEPVTGPFDTTGGTKFTYNGKTIHAFTSPGTMTCTGQGSAVMTYFIIGGGGGGGGMVSGGGGGGGAGAYHTGDTPTAITGGDTSFPVVVGGGGAAGTLPVPPPDPASRPSRQDPVPRRVHPAAGYRDRGPMRGRVPPGGSPRPRGGAGLPYRSAPSGQAAAGP